MKVFRCCLLLLLSLALPLQAALAASLGACIRHADNPPAQAQPLLAPAVPAGQPAPAAAVGDPDCLQHHAAAVAAPSATDHGCSNCAWCSLGTALHGSRRGWVAAQDPQSPPVMLVGDHGAPTLGAPERPPRAIAHEA
jgi:hypothetical protein